MKKNYFLLILVFAGVFCSNFVFGQAQNDFVSIPNGTGPTVVIQNVLDNDLFQGVPATLSNVHFTSVSSTNLYLSLDQSNGSVIFSNGPAPIGNYILDYYYDAIGSGQDFYYGNVSVNIGCPEISAPVVTNALFPNCSTFGSISFAGLPDGAWQLFDNNALMMSGTGNTATLSSVYASADHSYQVGNASGCRSPQTIFVTKYLSAVVTGTYVDTDSNGVPSVGDQINYTAVLTNTGGCTLTNIISTGNSVMNGGPIPSLAVGASNNNTFTYSYAITQANINSGNISKSFLFTAAIGSSTASAYVSVNNYLNHENGIKLVAFIDTNNNGIKDGAEEDFNYGTFTYEVNTDGTMHNIYVSPSHSAYLYETNPATSYDIDFAVNAEYAPYYGLASATINNITVPIGSGITTYYFPLTFVPFNDLQISVYGVSAPPRPGFTYKNNIHYRNFGTSAMSGTVTFNKSSTVSITNIGATGAVPTADGFTYDFTGLMPGESRDIVVTMLVPTIPTVALGDLVTNMASISIPAGDINESNNTASLTQLIVGSYDPNEKDEVHGGKVLYSGFSADDYLTYKIQFENTGTANAEFIRVVDVLDDKLDETSVRMIDASHNYVLDRVDHTLTWMFNDIQLPPSVANSNIGHGYVVFKVKPKAGYALGDIIPNIANIYFDFNPAIVTNPCLTEFVNTLATQDFTLNHFKYAPNPVKSTLSVSNENPIQKLTVTSVLGQIVLEKNINALNGTIDLSGLAKGVYLVKATSISATKTFKVVKE